MCDYISAVITLWFSLQHNLACLPLHRLLSFYRCFHVFVFPSYVTWSLAVVSALDFLSQRRFSCPLLLLFFLSLYKSCWFSSGCDAALSKDWLRERLTSWLTDHSSSKVTSKRRDCPPPAKLSSRRAPISKSMLTTPQATGPSLLACL